MLWQLLLIVFASGCVGGFVNGLLTGELVLPHYRNSCRTYFPGILGNIILGGIGAIVFWGIYGPLADVTVMGTNASVTLSGSINLSLGDLLGSLVVGMGGGRMLTIEAQRRCLKRSLK